jgi:hypothetical protein
LEEQAEMRRGVRRHHRGRFRRTHHRRLR